MAKIEHRKDHDDKSSHHDQDDDTKTTKYNFDVFGNLKSVSLPDGKLIEYIIDGQNRRVGKKINGKLVQGFIYQSQTQIAAELDGGGSIVKQFVYGSKSNTPDYMIFKGKKYRIISDQVGAPKLVIDSTTGKIVEKISMDEFGNDQDVDGKHLLPFGFAGGLYDQDTKLVHFGARAYDPEVGRFLSKDPTLFKGGTNLYSYTMNDPINFIDPTGKSAWSWVGAGVIAIGTGVYEYNTNPFFQIQVDTIINNILNLGNPPVPVVPRSAPPNPFSPTMPNPFYPLHLDPGNPRGPVCG